MKHLKSIIVTVLVLLTFFWSCEPPVVFSEPQPKDVDSLTSIPEHFQGSFWCDIDSVSIDVTKTTIYKSKLFDVELPLKDIKDTEDVTFENGQLFFKDYDDSFPATEKNGIVYAIVNLKDTIFSNQTPKHVLKSFKGHLVLNNEISDKHWEVKIMSLRPTGSIAISTVEYPENLTDLQTITTVELIETRSREQILVSPTKTEFDQIMDKNLIFTGSCQEFRPVFTIENSPL